MKKNSEFYDSAKTYKHNELEYLAVYEGRGYRNRHTYKVVNPGRSTFNKGDIFTPNEPEKYFTIIDIDL